MKETERQGKMMKMGRQSKTPAGSSPALAAAPSTTQKQLCGQVEVSGNELGGAKRTGISPCTGELDRAVRWLLCRTAGGR